MDAYVKIFIDAQKYVKNLRLDDSKIGPLLLSQKNPPRFPQLIGSRSTSNTHTIAIFFSRVFNIYFTLPLSIFIQERKHQTIIFIPGPNVNKHHDRQLFPASTFLRRGH